MTHYRLSTLAIAFALAATAVGAALAPGAAHAQATADRGAPAGEPRTVSVSGQGEVRALPDLATATLGITARHRTLDGARQQANRVVEALLALTRELRIPSAQVRSTRIAVSPEYTWNEQRRAQDFVGYVVTRQLIVELRDLEQLGTLMEKSVSAGANLVQEPQLDSSRRADLERQALALAVEDARRNADVLARAVGMSVGAARNVTGNGTSQRPGPVPVAMMMRAGVAAQAEAPQTYQTGELVYSAQANVTWDLTAAATPAAR